ncbi:MAG: signal peptidase [Flavobacterium sp.]|nr:MAG: signal peptidase [Flavobacterium sp.]
MKNIIKFVNIIFVFAIIFVNAQLPSQPVPPGGQGTTGTGSQSVPVDMYVYILAIAALLMIVYFAKKYKTQKI